jgi:hypothetical protein
MNQRTGNKNNGKIHSRGLLYRIYELKIRQVVIILFSFSALLYLLEFIGNIASVPKVFTYFSLSPFPALADICLTSAIIGFTFELLVRGESEASMRYTLRQLLQDQTTFLLTNLPKALLLRKDLQKELLKEEKIDEILLTSLQTKFSDDQMAEGLLNGIIRNATEYEEKWSKYRYEIFIEDIIDPEIPAIIREEYFDIIMRISYETKLKKTRFIFTCAKNQDQFNDLLRNPDYEVRWLLPSSYSFKFPNEQCFEVLQFSVDNIPAKIVQKNEIDGRFEISCESPHLDEKIDQNVSINYTFKVKAEKIGHVISTTVTNPTKDVTVEVNFAKASISYVDVLDYFVSARKPAIRYIPNEDKPYKISVELKEWVFPKGGATFIWILKSEQKILLDKRKKMIKGETK